MDAKRVAEIREIARNGDVDVGTLELITLCNLAERGLAIEQAMIDATNLDDDWLTEDCRKWIYRKAELILAASTNENGKG